MSSQAIANYLITRAEIQKQIDAHRMSLAQIPQFNPSLYFDELGQKIPFQQLLEKEGKPQLCKIITQELNNNNQRFLTYAGFLNLIKIKHHRPNEWNKTILQRTNLQYHLLYSKSIPSLTQAKINRLIAAIAKLKYIETAQLSSLIQVYPKSLLNLNNIKQYVQQHSTFYLSPAVQPYLELPNLDRYPKKTEKINTLQLPYIPQRKQIKQPSYQPEKDDEYLIRFMSRQCLQTNMGNSFQSSNSSAFFTYEPKQTISTFRSTPKPKRIMNLRRAS